MAEAASHSYASGFCIERKPNAVSAVLKNKCGAWVESLATRQLWQAEKKGSAQGEESVLLWPERSSLSRTIPSCGPSENFDERTNRFPAGLRRLFWLTNGSGGRFFLDAKALKRGSSGETTPEEKSFFSEYHGSASSIWRKALPVSSAPIHQKVGRADLVDTEC